MRLKISSILVLGLMLLSSCDKNDCGDYACFTPPNPFVFELVDEVSKENLFTNGTFDPQNIEVLDLLDSSQVEFFFLEEDSINLIQLNSIGWETETVNYVVLVSGEIMLNLYVNAERVSEDCCSFTRYHEVEITEANYELENSSGIYKVLVP